MHMTSFAFTFLSCLTLFSAAYSATNPVSNNIPPPPNERYPTWKEEIVQNDQFYDRRERGREMEGDWSYQQNWQYTPGPYLRGETQNEYERRIYPSENGVGYGDDTRFFQGRRR